MWVRAIVVILFALTIDILQFLVSITFMAAGTALTLATPIGGGVGGALAGCYTGATGWYDLIGCVQGGFIGAGLGAMLSFFGGPMGVGMGIVFNTALSITLGSALIFLLGLNGMLHAKYLWNMGGDFIPGLNNLPFWTLFTVRCVIHKDSGVLTGEAQALVSTVTKATSPTGVASAATTVVSAVAVPARTPTREKGSGQDAEVNPKPQPKVPLLNSDIKPKSSPNDTIKKYGLAA